MLHARRRLRKQRGRFEGRGAILENMANVNHALGDACQRHVTTNVNISLDGDRGTATAYFIYCVGRAGKLEITAFGKYEDELRKQNGRCSSPRARESSKDRRHINAAAVEACPHPTAD
jgi:SnoaL-like domain